MKKKILNRSIPEPNTGCWLWGGHTNEDGYGKLSVEGKLKSAHRVSFEAFNGKITKGLLVCHKCDTPQCVNPDHLFLGTQLDNMRDMSIKGRGAKFKDGVKIKEETVLKIMERIKECVPFKDIAREFFVSASLVAKINNGKNWTRVTKGKVMRRYGQAVLKMGQVEQIRELIKSGSTNSQLMRSFKVSRMTIHRIRHNQSWAK